MSLEAIALAVLNASRPGGIAATYALLSSPRPRRLLGTYVLVGFAWSTLIGIFIVSALGEVDVGRGDSTINSLIDMLAGVALLGFGAGLASGRLASGESTESGPAGLSRLERRLRNPSGRVAAGAGIATHLPGLFYLLGLNALLSGDPGFVRGVIQVVIFNLIWFSIPAGALLLSVRDPERTRAALGRLSALGRRHGRTLVILFALAVGAYFATRGALELAGIG